MTTTPIRSRPGAATHLLLAALLATPALLAPAAARAQSAWSLDPGVLTAGQDLLQRVPPAQLDGLLAALHGATRDDAQAHALCALFAPGGDRSLQGLDDFASRLGDADRQRLTAAAADALLASLQSPPQADDRALGVQGLKAAAVSAAFLHDGFGAGWTADASTPEGGAARCRSLRWLLDALRSRPLPERAATTRLLLQQGLEATGPAMAARPQSGRGTTSP